MKDKNHILWRFRIYFRQWLRQGIFHKACTRVTRCRGVNFEDTSKAQRYRILLKICKQTNTYIICILFVLVALTFLIQIFHNARNTKYIMTAISYTNNYTKSRALQILCSNLYVNKVINANFIRDIFQIMIRFDR